MSLYKRGFVSPQRNMRVWFPPLTLRDPLWDGHLQSVQWRTVSRSGCVVRVSRLEFYLHRSDLNRDVSQTSPVLIGGSSLATIKVCANNVGQAHVFASSGKERYCPKCRHLFKNSIKPFEETKQRKKRK